MLPPWERRVGVLAGHMLARSDAAAQQARACAPGLRRRGRARAACISTLALAAVTRCNAP
jgi:hypothetical protein